MLRPLIRKRIGFAIRSPVPASRITTRLVACTPNGGPSWDALRTNPEKIKGSKLYFTRVDEKGEIKKSGKPYCTVCSRLALDAGIDYFLLWHDEGVCEYKTDEYDRLSRQYTSTNMIKLGKYKHFKGKEYEVVGVAKHSETMEDLVVYRALYDEGSLWVRPLKMFLEEVEVNGKKVPRFSFIG